MTGHILALAVANVLMLVFGCGLLPLLRLAHTRRELVVRAPLGYAIGLAATGILAADLAVVWVPVGRVVLPLLAAAALVLGLRRVRSTGRAAGRRVRAIDFPPVVVLAMTGVLAVPAARLFAVKPLLEFDGWAIWGLRARALYDFGHPISPVFTSPEYTALQHPLLLPALEALDFRFMGSFDGTTIHLQLLGLAVGFVGGAWVLLRRTARPFLLAATLLAIVCTPTFFNQLQTNYADVPLALFVALGVAALATWLHTGAAGMLPAATVFLAAGALTKNEGEWFALAAFLTAFAVARHTQRRPLLLAALAVGLADLPWRLFIAINNVQIAEYSLSDLFNPGYLAAHADRVWPSVSDLVDQIARTESWSYLVPLTALAFAAAVALRRFRASVFGAVWLLLSFSGLVAIYWISTNPLAHNLTNSSDRTIDSLVLVGALLVPVLLGHDTPPDPRGTPLGEHGSRPTARPGGLGDDPVLPVEADPA